MADEEKPVVLSAVAARQLLELAKRRGDGLPPRRPEPNWWPGGAQFTSGLPVMVIFDGFGQVLTSSLVTQDIWFSNPAQIAEVVLLGEPNAGNLQIAISKCTFASFPGGSSIVASAPPTLSSAQSYQDTTLAGWTKAINPGDCLRFSISGTPTVITWAALFLA